LDYLADQPRHNLAQNVTFLATAGSGGIHGEEFGMTPLRVPTAKRATVGHDGSVLVALRTVRLLT
jgi:hypothetical protein